MLNSKINTIEAPVTISELARYWTKLVSVHTFPALASVKLCGKAKGEVKISASSTEAGESEDSLEVAYTGETLTIGFNAQYLVEFLKAAGTSEVRLELKDSQSAGQLRPAEGDDYKYRYIVMPMRI